MIMNLVFSETNDRFLPNCCFDTTSKVLVLLLLFSKTLADCTVFNGALWTVFPNVNTSCSRSQGNYDAVVPSGDYNRVQMSAD
jgi:hypothetical protein